VPISLICTTQNDNCLNFRKNNQKSDVSQDFRPADILGVPQAIKGFDKSDFCEVFNVPVPHG